MAARYCSFRTLTREVRQPRIMYMIRGSLFVHGRTLKMQIADTLGHVWLGKNVDSRTRTLCTRSGKNAAWRIRTLFSYFTDILLLCIQCIMLYYKRVVTNSIKRFNIMFDAIYFTILQYNIGRMGGYNYYRSPVCYILLYSF